MTPISEIIASFMSSGVVGAIALILVLVFAFVIGIFRKTFMSLWDLLIFISLFIVSYLVLMPKFGDWICDKFMLQFGLNSTINVNGIDVYQVNSFGDLIRFMCLLADDAKTVSEEYANNLAHSMTYAMALSVLSLAILIVTPLLSLITWPLIKLAIPKKFNHANKRFVGPIVSVLETIVVFMIVMASFGSYSEGFIWMMDNPTVLESMDVPVELFNVIRIFTKDFFGFFKYLDFGLFKFQFVADGVIYNTSQEMKWLAQKVIPEGLKEDAAGLLSEEYKVRLLEIWLEENSVSLPTAGE